MEIYCLPIHLPWDEIDNRLMKLVSSQRQEKIQRYVYEADRKLSLYSALLARLSLSIASGQPALNLVFARDARQKPVLLSAANYHFNISHTQGFVLCGVSEKDTIGVDVEKIAARSLKMMKQVFHPDEIDYIESAPVMERNLKFYMVWTRKEAYVKQLGIGLNRNLPAYNTLSGPLSSILYTWRNGNYVCSVCSHSDSPPNIQDITETDIRNYFLHLD